MNIIEHKCSCQSLVIKNEQEIAQQKKETAEKVKVGVIVGGGILLGITMIFASFFGALLNDNRRRRWWE